MATLREQALAYAQEKYPGRNLSSADYNTIMEFLAANPGFEPAYRDPAASREINYDDPEDVANTYAEYGENRPYMDPSEFDAYLDSLAVDRSGPQSRTTSQQTQGSSNQPAPSDADGWGFDTLSLDEASSRAVPRYAGGAADPAFGVDDLANAMYGATAGAALGYGMYKYGQRPGPLPGNSMQFTGVPSRPNPASDPRLVGPQVLDNILMGQGSVQTGGDVPLRNPNADIDRIFNSGSVPADQLAHDIRAMVSGQLSVTPQPTTPEQLHPQVRYRTRRGPAVALEHGVAPTQGLMRTLGVVR